MTSTRKQSKVVIVGAGFAGLWAARRLKNSPVDILLLDQNNFHTFSPLLYQVATGALGPEDVVYPVRTILRNQKNIRFLMKAVTKIDLSACQVKTSDDTFPFDYLVLAIGSKPYFYKIPGIEDYAYKLHTLEQATSLKNHILYCFERALSESDSQERKKLLTFAIAGGGPTGVEFAGALSELINGPMIRDYRGLDPKEMQILLFEGSTRLLNSFPETLSNYAKKRLHDMGVEVRLLSMVNKATPNSVQLSDGTEYPTETLVWTGGVQGKHVDANLPVLKNQQIRVLQNLQVPDFSNVYVVGDLAFSTQNNQPLPMLGPVATQQGKAAAQNIMRQIIGKSPIPFVYHGRGTMATIGRNSAVANISGLSFSGFFAWLIWLFVHLFNLIGFRNRLLVLTKWAWDYLFYKRTVRFLVPLPGLGTRASEKNFPEHED